MTGQSALTIAMAQKSQLAIGEPLPLYRGLIDSDRWHIQG